MPLVLTAALATPLGLDFYVPVPEENPITPLREDSEEEPARLVIMDIILQLPDEIARHLAGTGDVSRYALEAIAVEGYRSRRLTLFEVSRLLGLSRAETEDFLGGHQVSLASYDEAELDREAEVFSNAGKRSA